MRCDLCKGNIEETFLEKIKGTIIKIRKGEKNEIYYICSECQKKHKDIKKELSK